VLHSRALLSDEGIPYFLPSGRDYILTARAKGLAEKTILFKHALKNAMLPMTTMITLEFAYMLTGSIFIGNDIFVARDGAANIWCHLCPRFAAGTGNFF
jgi:ABC-type microcin C transport system permease subunit YejB